MGNLFLGENQNPNIKFGEEQMDKIYLGNDLVWDSSLKIVDSFTTVNCNPFNSYINGEYLYVADYLYGAALYKINKNTFEVVAQGTFESWDATGDMIVAGDYLYVVSRKLIKYNKNTLALVAATAANTYMGWGIYYNGDATTHELSIGTSGQQKHYRVDTLASLRTINLATYNYRDVAYSNPGGYYFSCHTSGAICKTTRTGSVNTSKAGVTTYALTQIVHYLDYLYVAGEGPKVIKLYKSNLNKAAESADLTTNQIRGLETDGTYVYASVRGEGDINNYIVKLNCSDLSEVSRTYDSAYSVPHPIKLDGNYLYVPFADGIVRKFNK